MTVQTAFWWEREDGLDQALAEDQAERDRVAQADHEADLNSASHDVQSAHARYDEALRRSRCAPHGELASRRCDLRVANERVLRAELDYAEIGRRGPRWD